MAAVQDNDAAQQARHQQWYDPDITEVPAPMRTLLETYSKVPSDQVVEHVNKIRQQAFASNPYPCIGHYRFLNLTLPSHPQYRAILSRLSAPSARYLDIGCCLGQDLRQLVADGARSSQLTGLDIEGALMAIGHDLFLDSARLQSRFVVADVFAGSAQGDAWTELEALGFDVIHCSAFFHLFPLADQERAARNIARLAMPGALIVGRQSGSVVPAEVPAVKAGSTSFRHDVGTFQGLWDRVGEATGTRWEVEGELDRVGLEGAKKNAVEDENSRRLLFTVRRLE